jgi:hypothetical protein
MGQFSESSLRGCLRKLVIMKNMTLRESRVHFLFISLQIHMTDIEPESLQNRRW